MPFSRKGSRFWWINVRGIRQSSRTDDFDAAKALEDKLNHQAWLQKVMGLKPPRSWKESVVKFLQERKHQASISDTIQRLRWFDPYLGTIEDIRLIDRDMMNEVMQKREVTLGEASSANSTANRYVAAASAVLNAACREWNWIERSPKFMRYKEPDGRDKWLNVDEWRRLETELPQHLRRAATFALATGLRDAKVFGLEWNQIDMSARRLTTKGTANKLGVTIPLNATAMAVLMEIKGNPVRHLVRVFTYEGKPLADYGKAWNKALKRAGIEGFTWHGLRHTFNSWLAQAGVPEDIRKQLCGWSRRQTVDRYTHLMIDHLRPHCAQIDTILTQNDRKTLAHTA